MTLEVIAFFQFGAVRMPEEQRTPVIFFYCQEDFLKVVGSIEFDHSLEQYVRDAQTVLCVLHV